MGWLLSEHKLVRYNVPAVGSFEELRRYMAARAAKYFIVERDSLRERLPLLSEYFEIAPDNNLVVRNVPPGWRIAERDPYGGLDFVILERVAEFR